MKRYLFLICIVALSCSKEQNLPSAGKCVGQIHVMAEAGHKSVLVSKEGLWKVCSRDSWITVDVQGREGLGAFTFTYGSNESDFISTRSTRKGAIIIESMAERTADTIYVVQQGVPDGKEYFSSPQDSYIEFIDGEASQMKVIYANFDGAVSLAAVQEWIASSDADVVAYIYDGFLDIAADEITDKGTIEEPAAVVAEIDGINFVLSDFSDCTDDYSRYDSLKSLLNQTYDRADAGKSWIVGGSFYYYSAFETGYPETPSWFPSDPQSVCFEADRYAHLMNLTDCVWMTRKNWTPTWESEGISWRPDYVYLSEYIWNRTTKVDIIDCGISGTTHKAICVTIKY
ncbi:MAG: BACON domain-containing protein [Bacteroidales bacterium]|nr:BACON domain-containing protein [Bacteroidales bacterium]